MDTRQVVSVVAGGDMGVAVADEKLCKGECGRVLPNTPKFFRSRTQPHDQVPRLSTTCKRCLSMNDKRTRAARLCLPEPQYVEEGEKKSDRFDRTLLEMEEQFGPYAQWKREHHNAFTFALLGKDPDREANDQRPVDFGSPFFRAK
jgi:hypothetical protein